MRAIEAENVRQPPPLQEKGVTLLESDLQQYVRHIGGDAR